ncbi:MAG: hypothetical protein R6X32_06260 [Chloroflexota bacterium]
MKRLATFTLLALLFTFAFASTALAASKTHGNSGITLFYPDNTVDCEPTFVISTTGVPASFSTQYNIVVQAANGSLVNVASGSSNGNLNTTYTPPTLEPGTSQTYAVFLAVFNANGLVKAKIGGKWTVTCAAD